jgi:hypothetical protein
MINPALLYAGNGAGGTPKYLFSKSGADTSSGASLAIEYDEAYTIASDIHTNQGVGTPGILTTVLTYARGGTYLEETVNIDTTDATTFMNDINNWLFLNNFIGIHYDSGDDVYIIDDVLNETYIHILYITL